MVQTANRMPGFKTRGTYRRFRRVGGTLTGVNRGVCRRRKARSVVWGLRRRFPRARSAAQAFGVVARVCMASPPGESR